MDIASSHPRALFSSKASAALGQDHGVGGPGGSSASTKASVFHKFNMFNDVCYLSDVS